MYIDPTSALLVALFFDSIEILSEKTRGGSLDDYYKEQIAQKNRNLNGSIRRIRKKYGPELADSAIEWIQREVRITTNSFDFQKGQGKIIIDPDNIDYIVLGLEQYIAKHQKYESLERYREKIEVYRKAIETVKAYKIEQEKAAEEMRIKQEKELEIASVIKLIGIIILAIALLLFIVSLSN